MRRFGISIALALLASTGSAQPGHDPLMWLPSTDPLDLAIAVDRLGDEGVLTRLAEGTPLTVRAMAVLAAPQMDAPETSLSALAEIARGRDPDLAPRAAL